MRFLICISFILCLATTSNSQIVKLELAHAHNDYYHKRPLLDALEQGFQSVEADVFLRDGKLLVAHTIFEIREERTLENLYLNPLFQKLDEGDSLIGDSFLLWIDLKSKGSESLKVLNKLLAKQKKHLTRLEDGKVVNSRVTVVISGDRPKEEISKASNRLVFLDGRLSDPEGWGAEISPFVSESWATHFRYRGLDKMTEAESIKLRKMVQKIHKQKKRIRFWALPDRTNGWQVAFDAGVDLINTDKLTELRQFLALKEKRKQ